MKDFDNELHEQLFAMFILKASSSDKYERVCILMETYIHEYVENCKTDYAILWEDRSIANVEYEGFLDVGGKRAREVQGMRE